MSNIKITKIAVEKTEDNEFDHYRFKILSKSFVVTKEVLEDLHNQLHELI